MEDDGERDEYLTPFWLQTTADLRRGDRFRRSVSAVLFSSGLVVFLLLVAAAAFLLFLLPSTLSLTANVFRPNGVKKSWDSINIVLVLVAVVFGFLSRNKNDDRYSDGEFQTVSGTQFEADEKYVQKSEVASSSPRHWYVFSELQDRSEGRNSFNLRKNSSSYPDLREFSYGDYQRRFFDDSNVDSDRIQTQAQDLDRTRTHRRHRSMEEVEILRAPPQTKTIVVDTLLSEAKEAGDSGWIRTQAQDLDRTRTHRRHRSMQEAEILRAPPQTKTIVVDTLLSKAKEAADSGWIRTQAQDLDLDRARIHRRHRSMEEMEILRAPPQAKTIVVDTLLSEAGDSPAEENRRSMNQIAAVPRKERSRRPVAKSPPPSPRKRGGATANATKDFLNSIYHKKKKTKQRQKSVDNLDSLHAPATYQIPPPPPPPPPPSSPSVLHNLFSSKKQKRKRTIKVIVAPPAQNPKPQISPSPAAQVRSTNPIKLHTVDEASNSGGESVHRAPPPPPPPPPPFFKTAPAWRFVVQGDYVRVNSSTSSRSGSPDLDELDSDVTPSSTAGGDVTPFHPSPLFCPSPDVNTKAESFISSFRAKLKLEKAHSMKKREPGLSTLGPR